MFDKTKYIIDQQYQPNFGQTQKFLIYAKIGLNDDLTIKPVENETDGIKKFGCLIYDSNHKDMHLIYENELPKNLEFDTCKLSLIKDVNDFVVVIDDEFLNQ